MDASAIQRIDIAATLSKIRSLASSSHFKALSPTEAPAAQPFANVFAMAKQSLASVNQSQLQTDAVRSSYLTGDNQISMSQVMMASMKSKVAFEGLLAVRNKLLESYKEIMNMPI